MLYCILYLETLNGKKVDLWLIFAVMYLEHLQFVNSDNRTIARLRRNCAISIFIEL